MYHLLSLAKTTHALVVIPSTCAPRVGKREQLEKNSAETCSRTQVDRRHQLGGGAHFLPGLPAPLSPLPFLSSRLRPRRTMLKSFEDARTYVRTLGLNSQEDWQAWSASVARPHDIPGNPHGTTFSFSGRELMLWPAQLLQRVYLTSRLRLDDRQCIPNAYREAILKEADEELHEIRRTFDSTHHASLDQYVLDSGKFCDRPPLQRLEGPQIQSIVQSP